MSDEIVSLRIVIVSPAVALRDLLRQGAGSVALPVDVAEVDRAAGAFRLLSSGETDLVLIDAAVASEDLAAVIDMSGAVENVAARSSHRRPFVILIAPAGACDLHDAAGTDGVVSRPGTVADAQALIGGFARLRIPSRVLVVDDSSTMRSIIRKILMASRFPVEITEAEEGVAALRQIAGGNYDFVMLDYNMPGLNGIETLSEIKRQYPRTEVVMVTSTANDEVAQRARACGAAAFLKKPFYPTDIDTVLLRICGTRATAGLSY